MKILITGAAGHVGRATVQAALDDGHDAVATDTLYRPGLPVRLHLADLLDFRSVYPLLEGADAVIHVANHPHRGIVKPDQRLLVENLTMSANVFTAATELGVDRICFASSIQAVASDPRVVPAEGDRPEVRLPPYVPLDGDLPAATGTNPYAQSKAFAEELLRCHAAERATLHAVALRLPWIIRPEHAEHFRGHRHPSERRLRWALERLHEGWSYLHQADAAAALLAGITHSRPGFHAYLPARSMQDETIDLDALLQTYAPDVPRRGPLTEHGLIDLTAIREDLGWEPREPAVVLTAPCDTAASGA